MPRGLQNFAKRQLAAFIQMGSHCGLLWNCAQRTQCSCPLSRKRSNPAWPSSRICATIACLLSATRSKACPTAKRIVQLHWVRRINWRPLAFYQVLDPNAFARVPMYYSVLSLCLLLDEIATHAAEANLWAPVVSCLACCLDWPVQCASKASGLA